VWKYEIADTIFLIYSSDILLPFIGLLPGSCPAGLPLNPALNAWRVDTYILTNSEGE
jgi:hypothetical protein